MRAREREGRGKNQHGSCRVWNQTAVSSLWKGGYIGWSGHGEGGACWGLEKFQMLVWVVITWCAHAKEKCTEGVHLNVLP